MRPALLLLAMVAATSAGIAPGAAAAPAAPKKPLAAPKALGGTLQGTALAVTWTKASGTVQLKVRKTTVRGKAGSITVLVAGRAGRFDGTIKSPSGAALAPESIRIQGRRCAKRSKGRVTRCGRFGKAVRAKAGAPSQAGPNAPVATLPAPAASSGSGPTIGTCPMLPAGHAFNQDVSTLPLDPASGSYLASIGTGRFVHPDFGSADLGAGPGGFGIPYRVVPASQPLVRTVFGDYADESDPGPYPAPLDTAVEGGPNSDGDRHVLVVREGECQLYEMGNAYPRDGYWDASGGAKWDLTTGTGPQRKPGYTSADAAGLPILPGLARYDEVAAGEIRHALRFTVSRTQRGYIAPASHYASSDRDPALPPMGLRLRMRADYDISGMRGQALVIATALKRYGMIVADNGSDWYISGAPDPRWDDDDLGQLKRVPGSAFEVVKTGEIVVG